MRAVKSCGQLGILRHNIDLTQYVIEGKLTGRQLGKGYYGSVEEVRNFLKALSLLPAPLLKFTGYIVLY